MTDKQLRYIASRTVYEPATGCMIWQGPKTKEGYGVMMVQRDGQRSSTTVHRFMYQQATGAELPRVLELDHSQGCLRRDCWNPLHLDAVTHKENMERSGPAIKTHCINGHEYTPQNTIIRPNGHRRCRACREVYAQRRRAAEAAHA